MQNAKQKLLAFLYIVPIAVLIDQISKHYVSSLIKLHESVSIVGNFIRFTYVLNDRMMWGINPQKIFPNLHVTTILTVLMSIATIILIVYYITTKEKRYIMLCGFSLVMSGAIGNLIDRISTGKVVDFIDMGINNNIRWAIYNVADANITIGVILILTVSLLDSTKKSN